MNGNRVKDLSEYYLRHLVPHWLAQDQREDVHRLLSLETDDQRNAWYEARESQGDIAGYIQDVEQALICTEVAFSRSAVGDAAHQISLQYRYALILSTIGSLAQTIPTHLLVALVENGMRMPEQGLAYVQRIPAGEDRVDALVALAPYIRHSSDLLQQALDQIAQMGDIKHQTDAIIGLAPHLPEPQIQYALTVALNGADSIECSVHQARALLGLIPYLSQTQIAEISDEKILSSFSGHGRSQVINVLVPRLPENQIYHSLHLLQQVIQTGDELLLQTLANLLSNAAENGQAQFAIDYTVHWFDGEQQIYLLARLIPYLAEPLQQTAHVRMLSMVKEASAQEDARQSGSGLERLSLWELSKKTRIELMPYLPSPMAQEALSTTLAQWSPEDAVEPIVHMAERLSGEERGSVFEQALDMICRGGHGRLGYLVHREAMLEKLVPHLPESFLLTALDVASTLFDEEAQRTGHFLQDMPADARHSEWSMGGTTEDFWRAISASFDLEGLRRGLSPLFAIVRRAPDIIALALEPLLEIDNELARLHALSEVAPYLPEVAKRQALGLAIRLNAVGCEGATDSDVKAVTSLAMANLAQQLSDPTKSQLLQTAVESAKDISGVKIRTTVLIELAQYMPQPQTRALLQQALDDVRKIGDLQDQALLLGALAQYLPVQAMPTWLPEITDLVEGVYPRRPRDSMANRMSQQIRADALKPLVPLLAEHDFIERALEFIDEQVVHQQVESLARILPFMHEDDRAEMFASCVQWAQTNQLVPEWVGAVTGRASCLDESLVDQIAALAQKLEERSERMRLLARLSPHMSETLRNQITEEIGAILQSEEVLSLDILLPALHCLPQPVPERLEEQLWNSFQTELETDELWQDQESRLVFLAPELVKSLMALEDSLSAPVPQHALACAHHVRSKENRVAILACLVPFLPEPLRSETAQEILDTVDESLSGFEQWIRNGAQVQVLATIAPHVPDPLTARALQELKSSLSRWNTERGGGHQKLNLSGDSLAPLTELPTESAHKFWYEILTDATRMQRARFMNDTVVYRPLIMALGGNDAVVEVCESIQAVGAWWP